MLLSNIIYVVENAFTLRTRRYFRNRVIKNVHLDAATQYVIVHSYIENVAIFAVLVYYTLDIPIYSQLASFGNFQN